MIHASQPCPCGRTSGATSTTSTRILAYANCCGRWHQGSQALQAPDAEALMRSRYSAFVLALPDYLLATWHPRTRPGHIEPDEPGLRWLGLTVKQHLAQDADHATVEFVALCKLAGRAQRLHELSRFERDAQGRWLYLDGTQP